MLLTSSTPILRYADATRQTLSPEFLATLTHEVLERVEYAVQRLWSQLKVNLSAPAMLPAQHNGWLHPTQLAFGVCAT